MACLDYLCLLAGNSPVRSERTSLYINQGVGKDSVPTFKEMAAQYGLNDEGGIHPGRPSSITIETGSSTCYLLNNSFRPVGSFGYRNIRNIRSKLGATSSSQRRQRPLHRRQ